MAKITYLIIERGSNKVSFFLLGLFLAQITHVRKTLCVVENSQESMFLNN